MTAPQHPRQPALVELSASAAALQMGLALGELSVSRLWLDCLAHGARSGLGELRLGVRGLRELAPLEHNIAAAALNEHLAGLGLGRPVAYMAELGSAAPS